MVIKSDTVIFESFNLFLRTAVSSTYITSCRNFVICLSTGVSFEAALIFARESRSRFPRRKSAYSSTADAIYL